MLCHVSQMLCVCVRARACVRLCARVLYVLVSGRLPSTFSHFELHTRTPLEALIMNKVRRQLPDSCTRIRPGRIHAQTHAHTRTQNAQVWEVAVF